MVAGLLVWPSVSVTVYCTGFGLPLKVGSGVKVTLPVVGSTFHSPSPATFSSVTFAPVVGSSSLTLVLSIVLSPCGSVSLARTSTSTGWPFVPLAVSALAVGSTLAGGGVTASSGARRLLSLLVILPSLFFAVTVLPSLTASGSKVTLPVASSTLTPVGRGDFGVHLPLASFSTVRVCGWLLSSV